MKTEELLAQGLTEEQAKYVMTEHGKTVTTHNKAIEALKQSETALQAQITENNAKLEELGKQEGNSEELNKQIKELQTSNEELSTKLATTNKTNAIHNALRDASATDVEYLAYKLGDVELDDKGEIKDLDNKIKDLQTNHPTFFLEQTTEPAEPKGPQDFTTIPNKLKEGQQTTSFTMAQVENMSPQEINDNWDAVQVTLSQGGN